jgi:hypothetical protein
LLDEVVGSIDDKRKRKGTIDVLEKSRFFHLAIAGYSAESAHRKKEREEEREPSCLARRIVRRAVEGSFIPETDGYAARIIMKFLPSLRYLAYYY